MRIIGAVVGLDLDRHDLVTPEPDLAVPMRGGVLLFANMSRRADHTSAERYSGLV